MQNNSRKSISNLDSPELPDDLLEKVMLRIRQGQVQSARLRLFGFATLFFGSIAAFVPAWKMARAGFVESGFLQFLSLIYSNVGAVAANWKVFGMTLLESLPALEVAALSIVALVILISMKFFAKNYKIAFHKTNLQLIN